MNLIPLRVRPLLTLLAMVSLPVWATEPMATPAPAQDTQVESSPLPAPMMGMGMGMQHRMGDGPGKAPCNMRMGMGMAEGKPPCKGMGGKCAIQNDGLGDRVEALEKRLDALQMTLELLTRRPVSDVAR